MAVNTSQRQYSKKLIVNLFTVVLLGWLILLSWSMVIWVRFGVNAAQERLHQLIIQQRTTLIPFSDLRIHAPWMKLSVTGLSNQINTIRHALPQPNIEITDIASDAFQIVKQFWRIIGMVTQVMLIKLTIVIAALPLFILTMTAGLVDGLNQRAIRTASLGRESSYVFHQLTRYFKRGLTVLLGLWIAIPVNVTPALMFVPVSVLLSVMVSVTASRFKKYL